MNRLIREQREHDHAGLRAVLDASAPRIKTEQRVVFDTLKRAADVGYGGLYFVDGPCGTGKTSAQNAVLAHQRIAGKITPAVATSGIAAALLDGGATARSRFKIPVSGLDEDGICSIKRRSDLAQLLTLAQLIFWDEAVMCHRRAVKAAPRTLQDQRGEGDERRELPFSGVVVCFCGDFRQVLPIVPKGTRG